MDTRARRISAGELAGGKGPSTLSRVFGGIGGSLVRSTGLTTSHPRVVVGTRTITEPGAPWSLFCRVAWIDEEQKSRGEQDDSTKRVLESMDCRQVSATDTTVSGPFRFGRGGPVRFDSLKAIADKLGIDEPNRTGNYPIILERATPGGMKAYRVSIERAVSVLGMPLGAWRIARDDGSTIAALYVPPAYPCSGRCAMDVGSADPEELVMIRLLAAAVAIALR